MTIMRRFVLLLAIAAAAVPCIANATRASKTLILIAGRPSHGPGEHEFRAGSLLLQKALAGVSGLTVQVRLSALISIASSIGASGSWPRLLAISENTLSPGCGR